MRTLCYARLFRGYVRLNRGTGFHYRFHFSMDAVDVIYETELRNPTVFCHGRRYLGVVSPVQSDKYRVLLNTIQAASFFQHSYRETVRYLYEYSVMKPCLPPRILQLIVLQDDTYAVCDKTFWLRLVQRRWKRVVLLRRRVDYVQQMRRRELGYRIPPPLQLRGLLSPCQQ